MSARPHAERHIPRPVNACGFYPAGCPAAHARSKSRANPKGQPSAMVFPSCENPRMINHLRRQAAGRRVIASPLARLRNWYRSGLTTCRRTRLRAVCPCSPWHRAMCPHGPRPRGSNALQTGRSTSLGWQVQDGPISPLLPCCGSPQGPPCAKPAPQRVSTPTRPLWASPQPLSNDLPQGHYGSCLTPVAARFRGSFSLSASKLADTFTTQT